MKVSQTEAENIAGNALAFIISDEDLMQRFIATTGIQPLDLRAEAERPAFLVGVMQYLVENEDLLVAFASASGLKPEQAAAAAQALGVQWD